MRRAELDGGVLPELLHARVHDTPAMAALSQPPTLRRHPRRRRLYWGYGLRRLVVTEYNNGVNTVRGVPALARLALGRVR